MCVCAIITCAKLHHFVTVPLIATNAMEALGSLQAQSSQARLVLCCLDGERVTGSASLEAIHDETV